MNGEHSFVRGYVVAPPRSNPSLQGGAVACSARPPELQR